MFVNLIVSTITPTTLNKNYMGLIKYITIAAIERKGTKGRDLERLKPLIIEYTKKANKASIDAKKMVIKICIVPNHAPKLATIIKSP